MGFTYFLCSLKKIMASKGLCFFPKAGQTSVLLPSRTPRAAQDKIEAACHGFCKKSLLFTLLVKVLQRESEVFVLHES